MTDNDLLLLGAVLKRFFDREGHNYWNLYIAPDLSGRLTLDGDVDCSSEEAAVIQRVLTATIP